MIVRISSGTYIKGAVMYNENKVVEGEAKILVMKNFQSENIDFSEAIFRMTQQCRRSDNGDKMRIKRPVFSCSLNMNHVDLKKLESIREVGGEEAENSFYEKIAERYMEGMGYGNQPYIVYKHEDIERTHIHIVSIRVDSNKRKINDSHEHRRSERVRNEINREFGLSVEGENEKKGKDFVQKRNSYIEKARIGIESNRDTVRLKNKISNVLKFVEENYHPKNQSDYNKILSQFSIVCKVIEVVNNRGELINGCQYGVIDNRGKIVSHLIAGSKISDRFSYAKLNSTFMLNSGSKDDMRKNSSVSRKYIEDQLKSILSSPRKIDIEYISNTLHLRGIKMQLIENDTKGIIGVNYVDNVGGEVYSGSQIGRNYTYGNLCKSIENHNKKLEQGYVDREVYAAANRLLIKLYNTNRKKDYYFESDIIKDIYNQREIYESHLKNELYLTDEQARSCFNSFAKFKSSQLSSIEHKEESYLREQMIVAIRFASLLKKDSNTRQNILSGMNISIKQGNDNRVIYCSKQRDGLWIDSKELGSMDRNLEEVISYKNVKEVIGVEKFGKSDRTLIKGIVTGEYRGKIDVSSLHLVENIEDENLRKKISQKAITMCPDSIKTFYMYTQNARTVAMRENGILESEHIKNIEEHRASITSIAMREMGIGKSVSDALFDRYRDHIQSKLSEVEQKENAAIENRIKYSLKFAENISDTSLKTEFLKRMEISVIQELGKTYFMYDRKPSYKVREEKVSAKQQEFGQIMNDVKPFGKKIRDYVKNLAEGVKTEEHYTTVLNYLDKSKKEEEYAGVILNKAVRTLENTHIAQPSDVIDTLMYRGIIVIPTSSGKYKVGRYDMKQDVMKELPDDVTRILNRTNYRDIYDNYINRYVKDGKASAKLNLLVQISYAFDHKSSLDGSIKAAKRIDEKLSKAIEDVINSDSGSIDYLRILKLVNGYREGKKLTIPPKTIQSKQTSLLEDERNVILQNLKKYDLEYAVDLFKYGNDYMLEHKEEAEKKYKLKK